MKCCKCSGTQGVFHRTVPVGQNCEDWICEYCKDGTEAPKPADDSPFLLFESRKSRIDFQLEEWQRGNFLHNDVDDECCPDFSCCNKDVQTDQVMRDMYCSGSDEQRESMCYQFLGNAIAAYTDKKVYVANGKDSVNKDLN